MTIILLMFILLVLFIGIPVGIGFGIAALVKYEKNRSQNANVYGPVYRAPKPPRKKLSASSVMLLIGTIFIMLSAITFVAANWLNMEPVTRVFALAGAAVIAFAICGVMKAAADLVQTSSAFYMIGTLIAIVSFGTAGYYKLFGEWFSFAGMGCGTFLAGMAVLAAVSSFAGNSLYKHAAFHYAGFSFISLAIVFLCGQVADNFEKFATVISIAQLIITAILHVFKPLKGTVIEKPAEIIGDISAVIYQFVAMIYVVATTLDATWYTFAILSVILVQLFAYGFLKNQKWMFIFADIIGVYTAFTVSAGLEDEIGEPWSMILFGAITLVIYVLNYVIPGNLTISKIFSFIGFVIGAVVALNADSNDVYGINLFFPAVLTAIIMGYCLHKSKDIQFVAGLALPLMPLCMAYTAYDHLRINDGLNDELRVIVFGALTVVYILMASFFIFLPTVAFKFYAKHPVRAHSAEYTLMTAAMLALFAISAYSELFFIAISISIFHFIISCMMRNNITAAGSVISLIVTTINILVVHIKSDNIRNYIVLGLFALLVIVSRVVFPESLIYKKNLRTSVDVLLPTSLITLFGLTAINDITRFLIYIAVAIYVAAFIKKNTNKNTAAVLLSASALIVSFAFVFRPFLTFESNFISSKVNLGILVLLGVTYRFIWRNHKEISKIVSTLMFVLAFGGLIVDGIIHDSMANRIFVLAVTAAVLVFSFYAKSKTWFSVSSIALVILTVLLTARYFTSAGWWVYLLAVGVIFIAIAAVNEASRKKGESIKDTVSKTFSDWTW
ncbi:MAG: DUF2157 domain-containing protein [Ruminococcus sp.]|nr:DUF2157 domain-containing protein [Ruminococcus sp.]